MTNWGFYETSQTLCLLTYGGIEFHLAAALQICAQGVIVVSLVLMATGVHFATVPLNYAACHQVQHPGLTFKPETGP